MKDSKDFAESVQKLNKSLGKDMLDDKDFLGEFIRVVETGLPLVTEIIKRI